MNRSISLGFVVTLLLVFLAGVCTAAESPDVALYVQGGESSITNGTDGMMVITIKGILPYFHFPNGEKSILIPIKNLTEITPPLNAAVAFSGADNNSVSLVEISNWSFSEGNRILTLQVKPIEFYEGSALKSFAGEKNRLTTDTGGQGNYTGLYLEYIQTTPHNDICLICCPVCCIRFPPDCCYCNFLPPMP